MKKKNLKDPLHKGYERPKMEIERSKSAGFCFEWKISNFIIRAGVKKILQAKNSIIKIFNFRFCKRHSDYLSPDYSIGAKLPEHLEERSNRFKVVLQQLIKEKYFGPSEIGCMDELPLNLSPGK